MPRSARRPARKSSPLPPVILIRNSERSSFKRCRQQWAWNFLDLWRPQEDKPALKFGDLIHRTLEKHYPPGTKRKGKPWLIFDKLYMADLKKGMDEFRMFAEDEGWHDARELGNVMMRRYYDTYYEQDQAYEVLASEQVFQIPLIFTAAERVRLRAAAGGRKVRVVVVGTMDGVWRDRTGPKKQREIFIKEYKTTGKAISQVVRGLPLDEQAGTYWTFGPVWLWRQGVLPENVYPSKILYTIMYKSKSEDDRPEDELGRKLNRDGTVSKKQPAKTIDREPIFRSAGDRATMYQRVKEEAIEMIAARCGNLAIIKNPGPLFMPNCLGCAFQGPCELHESGHIEGTGEMFRALYERWDPYTSHELPERW